ncbi:MAG: TetR/AcrR family transcriptional regulator [Anaerolineae bacterium]|nr:TetR/AcrR family transcriptional regulator [Anaerolineae bacterium]
MPRYKRTEGEQIKAEVRRRLLEAAVDEFASRGYADANVNRISRAAGYAQGTIYNYFPSKQALFAAVVDDIASRHCQLVLQGTAGAADPSTRLERFFAVGCAFAEGFPGAVRLIASTLHGHDDEMRELVQRAYEPLRSYVEREIVQAGCLEQEFRPVEARVATAAILAVYLGGCAAGEGAERIRRNPHAIASLLLEGLRRAR